MQAEWRSCDSHVHPRAPPVHCGHGHRCSPGTAVLVLRATSTGVSRGFASMIHRRSNLSTRPAPGRLFCHHLRRLQAELCSAARFRLFFFLLLLLFLSRTRPPLLGPTQEAGRAVSTQHNEYVEHICGSGVLGLLLLVVQDLAIVLVAGVVPHL